MLDFEPGRAPADRTFTHHVWHKHARARVPPTPRLSEAGPRVFDPDLGCWVRRDLPKWEVRAAATGQVLWAFEAAVLSAGLLGKVARLGGQLYPVD